jgi:hypothetical protein
VKGGKEGPLGHGSKDQEGRVGGGFTGASCSLSITAVEVSSVQSAPTYIHTVMAERKKSYTNNHVYNAYI